VENKGITRNNVDPKELREGRDMMMILLNNQKPFVDEGGDVYLASSITHVDHEA
jgi:hypothetical protein